MVQLALGEVYYDVVVVGEKLGDSGFDPLIDGLAVDLAKIDFFVENGRPGSLLDKLLILILKFDVLV